MSITSEFDKADRERDDARAVIAKALQRSNRPENDMRNRDQREADEDASWPAYLALADAVLAVIVPADQELRDQNAIMAEQLHAARALLPLVAERADEHTYDELSSVLNDGPLDLDGDEVIRAGAADQVRAETLEEWAGTVRAEAEADERGLTDILDGELPQSSRVMLNGVTRAAERAVKRAAEYRKVAGA